MNRILLVLGACLCLGAFVTAKPSLAAEDEVNPLDLAALMLRDGHPDRAIRALDQFDVASEAPDLLRYFTLLGMAHLRLEAFEEAAMALESAAETGVAEPVVFVYLAQAYFSLERYRDVLGALDRAGPALARVASVYHMRAQCHWLLGEPAMALAVLDQASEAFPGEPGFQRRKVFFLMDLGLYREASAQGSAYLERSQGRLEDYVALGNAMRVSGELEESARLLEFAKLRYPADTDVKKVLANTYLNMGRVNAAADLVQEAALLEPLLIAEAAELYRRAGRSQRALMLNAQVEDQKVKLKQRLALYIESRQYALAAAMDRNLLRLGLLADEDIRYALAYAYFKIGVFDAAESHLQKLERPDLFRKAAELRRAMQECAEDTWQCL